MSKNTRKYKSFEELAGKPDKIPPKELEIALGECLVCKKVVSDGWYGRRGDKGTCGRVCERIQASKPLYPPPHDEESFLMRNESLGHNH